MDVLFLLLIIILIFLFIAYKRPDEFKVERSATMEAPAEAIFNQVNDFHKWLAWSPWAKLDLTAQNSFEGTASGVGAIFKWSGNKQVGAGMMTITDSIPNESINIRLDFSKPLVATNYVEFTFKPEGEHTIVNWKVNGTNNFLSKFISMFINCEKMIGKMYVQGLGNIKRIVEKSP